VIGSTKVSEYIKGKAGQAARKSISQSINVTPVAMKLKKLMPAIH
jgi:hypothetical protein